MVKWGAEKYAIPIVAIKTVLADKDEQERFLKQGCE